MNVTHLECTACSLEHEARRLHNLCMRCSKPLFVRYDLKRAARTLTRAALATRRADMWRYREVLPVDNDDHIVTLGEGWTPLVHARRLGDRLGLRQLYLKDEAQNPTHSFKARGMSAAVSMALALGARKLAVPSAGNAAGALAAYAARAGLEAHILVPRDTPRANIIECAEMGAHVRLVDGLITDCAAEIAQHKEREGWFEVSTLKEPYRVEGKKTMGYELAEQFDWELPDAIIYPTGGGTGLIGMWKAFAEMEEMGLIDGKRPRMIVVQAAGCAPIVRAFQRGQRHAEEVIHAQTVASGLRVPRAIGDFLILDAVRASGGTAVSVTDREMIAAVREIGETEGMFVAPEGAACLPALRKLLESGVIRANESVVLFNTGAGVKYLECFSATADAAVQSN